MTARIATTALILSAVGLASPPAQAWFPYFPASGTPQNASADTPVTPADPDSTSVETPEPAQAPTAEQTAAAAVTPEQPADPVAPEPVEDAPILRVRAVPINLPRPDSYLLAKSVTPSPDSTAVAYRHRFGTELDREGIAINSENVATIDRATEPTFAPDGKMLGYVRNNNGWELHVGRTSVAGYEPVTPVKFSPDGRRQVYMAREEDQRFIVDGDLAHPMADTLQWDRLVFTPDSTVLAYPAHIDGQWRMVINGDPGPALGRIVTDTVTAEKGPRAFYVAMRDGLYHVFDRHTAGPAFALIDSPPVVSADGSTCAYWAMDELNRWRVYKNHVPVTGYKADRPGQLILSADGKSLAAILKRGDYWFVVHNGKRSEPYTAVGKDSLTLSPDGQRLAYAVQQQRGWTVVLDGEVLQGFLQIAANSFRFSPDSKRFVYAAMLQGGWALMEKDWPQQSFAQIDTASLAFSPDSQHIAYLASDAGQAYAVYDGTRIGGYDHAQQLVFSPDSKHYAYVARQGDQARLYIDGNPTAEAFDELVPGAEVLFSNKTTCNTLAMRYPGPTLFRIEATFIPPPRKKPSTTPDSEQNGTPDPADTPAPTEPGPSLVDVPTN